MANKRLNKQEILEKYKEAKTSVIDIAKSYGVTAKTIQRYAKEAGIIRTQAEANRVAASYKKYYKTPTEMLVRRKHLTRKMRSYILYRDNFTCQHCGRTQRDGVRLEVDHEDEDPTNNKESNLQTLCNLCNIGKSHLYRRWEKEGSTSSIIEKRV